MENCAVSQRLLKDNGEWDNYHWDNYHWDNCELDSKNIPQAGQCSRGDTGTPLDLHGMVLYINKGTVFVTLRRWWCCLHLYNPPHGAQSDTSQERAAPNLMKSSGNENEEQLYLGYLMTSDRL